LTWSRKRIQQAQHTQDQHPHLLLAAQAAAGVSAGPVAPAGSRVGAVRALYHQEIQVAGTAAYKWLNSSSGQKLPRVQLQASAPW
jgi:hypothetical protein